MKICDLKLLSEIICLDDENFLIGGVTYLMALSLSIFTGVAFH